MRWWFWWCCFAAFLSSARFMIRFWEKEIVTGALVVRARNSIPFSGSFPGNEN